MVLSGTTTALGCMGWIFTRDWPLNIGGKPHFALPALIPITFETNSFVFCSRYGIDILLLVPDGAIC